MDLYAHSSIPSPQCLFLHDEKGECEANTVQQVGTSSKMVTAMALLWDPWDQNLPLLCSLLL